MYEWKPMSQAPKDGSRFLMLDSLNGIHTCKWFADDRQKGGGFWLHSGNIPMFFALPPSLPVELCRHTLCEYSGRPVDKWHCVFCGTMMQMDYYVAHIADRGNQRVLNLDSLREFCQEHDLPMYSA